MQSQKGQNDLDSFPKANFTVLQDYVQSTDAEEAEVDLFYEDLQDLLEHQKKKKKDVLFHKGMECKSRKSRSTH